VERMDIDTDNKIIHTNMNQFYIRLPSDSSMNTYPNNTVAHFNTKLAERIHLDEQFEVALTEFIYPNN